jgi:hypothetical protein
MIDNIKESLIRHSIDDFLRELRTPIGCLSLGQVNDRKISIIHFKNKKNFSQLQRTMTAIRGLHSALVGGAGVYGGTLGVCEDMVASYKKRLWRAENKNSLAYTFAVTYSPSTSR